MHFLWKHTECYIFQRQKHLPKLQGKFTRYVIRFSSLEVPTIIEYDKEKHLYFMNKALEEAEKAFGMQEAPVGAVIVKDNITISTAHNERESSCDATRHAEIIAISKAGKALGSWNLSNCDMYLTLEPCPMCAGALVQARIRTLYLGAPDPKAGAAGTLMNIPEDGRLNHKVKVVRGILVDECSSIMTRFFKNLRKNPN